MQATLTELRRRTAEVVGPVIHARKTVILTEHGSPRAKIVPLRTFDRKAATAALRALGPMELPDR